MGTNRNNEIRKNLNSLSTYSFITLAIILLYRDYKHLEEHKLSLIFNMFYQNESFKIEDGRACQILYIYSKMKNL